MERALLEWLAQLSRSMKVYSNHLNTHLWFRLKQTLCHNVPATFYTPWNECSSCREGDRLINWFTGLLRSNCMHIDSSHHGDTLRVCAAPLVLQPRLRHHISRQNRWHN